MVIIRIFTLISIIVLSSCTKNVEDFDNNFVSKKLKSEILNDLKDFHEDLMFLGQERLIKKLSKLEYNFTNNIGMNLTEFYVVELGINRDLVNKIQNYSEEQIGLIQEANNINGGQLELFYLSISNNQKGCGGWRPLRLVGGAVGTILACGSCAAVPNPSCYGCGFGVVTQIADWRSFFNDGCLS